MFDRFTPTFRILTSDEEQRVLIKTQSSLFVAFESRPLGPLDEIRDLYRGDKLEQDFSRFELGDFVRI